MSRGIEGEGRQNVIFLRFLVSVNREIYVGEEVRAGRLPKGSFQLLREALLAGEFERGQAPALTANKERMARSVLSQLLEHGLLVSTGPRAPVRLGFPISVVERWFAALYPANLN